jgi:hypothetical protein
LTFGQEMFSSMASIRSEPSKCRATSAYSSTVDPATFAMTFVFSPRSRGTSSLTTLRTPGFSSPIELISPAPPAVSTMRGRGFPSRGSSVVPFRTSAPMGP